MKKVYFYFGVLALSLTVVPWQAFAADSCNDPLLKDVQGLFKAKQYCTVNAIAVQAITILLSIIAAISALMIVIGGYRYVTSQGNDKSVTAAKNTITYALAGLVVAVMAYSLVSIINNSIK